MKQGIHPKNYRPVVFQDLNDGTQFITKSTANAEETVKIDGVEYPLIKVHISSSSHPFYTGQEKLLDMEGRVDKFKARQEAAKKRREERTKAAEKKTQSKGKTPDQVDKAEAEAQGEVRKLGTLKPKKK